MAMGEAGPAWDELATRLRPFVRRRVASEADADDVLQDVLMRTHRGLHALEDEARLGAWIHRIARNSIADHLRSRHRHPVASPDAPDEGAHDPFAEDEDTVAREVATYLAFFVALLPSPYREAITLTELEGRTQKQAAEMLGISVSGMKSRVQRGRAKLRAMLEACCEIAVDVRGKVVGCTPRPDGDPAGCCE